MGLNVLNHKGDDVQLAVHFFRVPQLPLGGFHRPAEVGGNIARNASHIQDGVPLKNLGQPIGQVTGKALAGALAQAVWHFTLIRTRTREGCFTAFRVNHWLGATVFAGIAGSYLLRQVLSN